MCAGGRGFQTVALNQCQPLVLNGLVSSYRCKLGAMRNGRNVSLGTVGTERLWRNLQRCARNKGRSVGCLDTLNMLALTHWICQATMRLRSAATCKHVKRAQDMDAIAHSFAAGMVFGSGSMAPLREFGRDVPGHVTVSLEDVGYLPRVFLDGAM